MKLYTLVCNYWNAEDWNNYAVNNILLTPTHAEILAIFTDKESAGIVMRSLSESEDFTLDLKIYESEDLKTTIEEIETMSHNERIKKFGDLLCYPVERLIIEQKPNI